MTIFKCAPFSSHSSLERRLNVPDKPKDQPALVFKLLMNLKISAGKQENTKHDFPKMRDAFFFGEKKN